MAEESYPRQGHNDRQVTDTEHELLASRFSDDGVYGDPTDTPVVSSGPGLSVTIRADVAASVRGHGWYSGSTPFSVGLSGNISSQPRVDWIVLRLDRATWAVTAAVVTGTPGSGAPALRQEVGDTGVWEIPLAQARILGGASSATATRAEQYVGTRCRPCTSTTRNPRPRLGEQCFETDTGIMRIWNGQSWRLVFNESGDVVVNSALSSWGIEADTVLEQKNGAVHMRFGVFIRTGGSLTTETRMPVLIPAAYRPATRGRVAIAYITGGRVGRLQVYANNTSRPGQVWLTQYTGTIARDHSVLPGDISWVVD
ncbi:hypothetical protein KVH24_23070 [Streptomyces olivaceus]|uniref:hypothetical protein n=1 Tax=Streptomyces olivaceus TaxID=47716 RepID=UPI001CCC0834|nr:hypothetical protein [Streptomyces olivaceus]MBZ6175605.1 hypothetical protein [Streptomyces olivaceus]MBZ6181853.1 hypothetical protein [Streptomyces olivaceus]